LIVLLLEEQRRGWSQMIFCARATRVLRRPSLDARSEGQTDYSLLGQEVGRAIRRTNSWLDRSTRNLSRLVALDDVMDKCTTLQ
jgi:hypothetical protein